MTESSASVFDGKRSISREGDFSDGRKKEQIQEKKVSFAFVYGGWNTSSTVFSFLTRAFRPLPITSN